MILELSVSQLKLNALILRRCVSDHDSLTSDLKYQCLLISFISLEAILFGSLKVIMT